jgi:TPR repeat protein/class 3 adenylate cyclase
MEASVKRKIAAILAADIAGYSRLVAEDEEETLRRLETYRAVFSDFIARFGGRVFSTAGDAMLAEFRSAVDAVRCAVDVQESLRTRNLAYASSRHMNYRIGIAIGDVVERDGDLLGDGVNIASRLEAIAPTNGICISRSVYEAVANKISLKFSDLGQQQLKNIPERVHAYTLALDQRQARPWPGSTVAMLVTGIFAVSMIAALGNATYLLSRSGARVVSSVPSITSEPNASASGQRGAPRNGAETKSPAAASGEREEKLAGEKTDRETSSRDRGASLSADAAAVTLARDRAPSPAEAKTVSPIEQQVESCRNYLPSIGTTVKVPCEEAKKFEPTRDVQAPELACDRLAAAPYDPNHVTQGIEFKVMDGPKAVEACREALRLYPQTSRFKFQLARALDRSTAYEEAIQLYRQLAEVGYSNAFSNLGALYDQGHGVAKDKVEAFRLFRQAAEKGVASAMNLVGQKYALGEGATKDQAEAIHWFRKGAEAGNREAMVNLGMLYEGSGVPKDQAEAFRLYRQAVEKGEPTAMNSLGLMYENGLGTAKDDGQAFRLYRQAAENGSVEGTLNLARFYANGRGVGKDEAQAVRLFRKAAEQGDEAGTYDLGIMYENGRGVAKDEAEAARLYRQVAEKGNARAMYTLGRMYAAGHGVEKDEAQAARWVFSAIEKGDDFAVREMNTNASAWGAGFRKELQRRLQTAGLYAGPSDGRFGPAVADAVTALAARSKQMAHR